jgi:hypothetical protein
MSDIGEKIAGIIGAIIGLAVLAIVISNTANTANVLSSFFGGLSNLIGVAISPVTGQSVSGLTAGTPGLQGGSWTSGFAIPGVASNFAGGLGVGVGQGLSSGLLSAIGGGSSGGGGSGLGSLLGSSGGSGAAAQDFVDAGAFA